MSNDSIINDLKTQMQSAAFTHDVKQHLDSMELTVLLTARLSGVPSDVLVIVLTTIASRILANYCPDHARAHYADLMKQVIDAAVQHSNKE